VALSKEQRDQIAAEIAKGLGEIAIKEAAEKAAKEAAEKAADREKGK
jgi:hypothetical protein